MSTTVLFLVNRYREVEIRNKIDSLLDDNISLDITLKKLCDAGRLSANEITVLNTYGWGGSFSSCSKELHISRWKFKQILVRVCNKLSKLMGWEYSDKRLKKVLTNKNITGRDLIILRTYLHGKKNI